MEWWRDPLRGTTVDTENDSGENLATLYDNASRLRPDDVAVIQGETGESITYGELAERTAAVGNVLADVGVAKGDRVVLMFPNEPEFLYTFFGAIRLGAVPVPLNIELQGDDLEALAEDTGASVVMTSGDREVEEMAFSVAGAIGDLDTILVAADDPSERTALETVSLTRTMEDVTAEREAADVAEDDPAFQLYTSGSTSKPKCVSHTHRGAWWALTVNRKVQFFDEDDRSLCLGPLYHKNALIGSIKPLLASGGSVVLLREFDSRRAVSAIEKYDVTCIRGVPAMYRMLLTDEEALADHDVGSLQWAVAGAGRLESAVAEAFEIAFDAPLGQSYGTTECGPVLLTPRWGTRKADRTGLPLPGVVTRIVDPESGRRVERGERGELLVSSPGLGNYDDSSEAEETAFEFIDGRRFFHTGDVAWVDEDGHHRIEGRLDDLLNVGGEKVVPGRVEDRLQEHPAVEEVAVVGLPHSTKGQAPVAFVVAAASVTESELKQYAIERGPTYAHPRRIFIEDELPTIGTGKIARTTLEEIALARIEGELSST